MRCQSLGCFGVRKKIKWHDMKYLMYIFGIAMLLAVVIYIDCRNNGGTPEFCRNMVFQPIGDRLEKLIPHFR
jgi:hypothetical protein